MVDCHEDTLRAGTTAEGIRKRLGVTEKQDIMSLGHFNSMHIHSGCVPWWPPKPTKPVGVPAAELEVTCNVQPQSSKGKLIATVKASKSA